MRLPRSTVVSVLLLVWAGLAALPGAQSGEWIDAEAFAVPKETTNQGSGYFSIVVGKNGRVYLGAAKYGVNAYLIEFDPPTTAMRVVVDTQKEIGTTATGFAAQSKIHTRNNVGESGKMYFGTKQGYPEGDEKRTDYPGGYPMVYDPASGATKVYGIPVPHQGIISVTPDESRGVAYLSTCSDERPIESTHFMNFDLRTGTYRDLMDCHHMFAFVVLDRFGRAYHPILGGDVARYDPRTDRLDRLKQTIDGEPPKPGSHLADAESHPINWDVGPDRNTLYAVAMSGNRLYSYDVTGDGDVLAGRDLGPLLPGEEATDCRAMCVGPGGRVWAAVWQGNGGPGANGALHLVSYRAGERGCRDHGAVRVSNPDYTEFTDPEGKPLPWHHGMRRTEGGDLVPLYSMGITEAADGTVYMTVICPLTLLRFAPETLRNDAEK